MLIGSIYLAALYTLLLLILAGGVAGGVFLGAGILQRLAARQKRVLLQENLETQELQHRGEVRGVQRELEIDALLAGRALAAGSDDYKYDGDKTEILTKGKYEEGKKKQRHHLSEDYDS